MRAEFCEKLVEKEERIEGGITGSRESHRSQWIFIVGTWNWWNCCSPLQKLRPTSWTFNWNPPVAVLTCDFFFIIHGDLKKNDKIQINHRNSLYSKWFLSDLRKLATQACMFQGGIKAVVWTAAVQMIILLVGLIAVAALGSVKAGGGEEVWKIAKDTGRVVFDQYVLMTFRYRLGLLIYLLHRSVMRWRKLSVTKVPRINFWGSLKSVTCSIRRPLIQGQSNNIFSRLLSNVRRTQNKFGCKLHASASEVIYTIVLSGLL